MTTPLKQQSIASCNMTTPCFDGPSSQVKSRHTPRQVRHNLATKIPFETSTRQIDDDEGEGIQVAIRMRPLNSKESTHHKVWKVLSKYSSVAQTTTEGKPLPERIAGRNFFTYDQTFDETNTTYEVYSAVAHPIVATACIGRNGTIFAYGQTSSGKTYTMQGSGSIEEGSSPASEHGGGILHMTANDIFSYVSSCDDRVFVIRASFMEIYNEEVRDLLQDNSNSNKILQIREDPRRGVFVQSREIIVTDTDSLIRVLRQGEKSRSFASTAMNERSSRSHTIFRITIESRSRQEIDDDDDENVEGSGAVRVSTLNLVDLAGSESVRHTGATGDRQKEGGLINQSLLTLSRVIVALGTPNSAHINFRDSKLTRILQPSLSGNARMAIVCCATPSELYLEETRSTLLFASRAKLVKTNAQINEVLDDRSIIKRLQRELILARSNQPGGNQIATIVAKWENVATSAGVEAKEAKAKLQRVYTSILMNNKLDTANVLLGISLYDDSSYMSTNQNNSDDESLNRPKKRHRRQQSDSYAELAKSLTPMKKIAAKKSLTVPSFKRGQKKRGTFGIENLRSELQPKNEIPILRQAIVAKNERINYISRQIDIVSKEMQKKDVDLIAANCSNDLLRSDRDEKSSLCSILNLDVERLKIDLLNTHTQHHEVLATKDLLITELQTRLQQELDDRQDLNDTIDALQDSLLSQQKEYKSTIESKDNEIIKMQEELELCRQKFDHATNVVNLDLKQQLAAVENEKNALSSLLANTTEALQTTSTNFDSVTVSYAALDDKCRYHEERIASLIKQSETDGENFKITNGELCEAKQVIEHQANTISILEDANSNNTENVKLLTVQNNSLLLKQTELEKFNLDLERNLRIVEQDLSERDQFAQDLSIERDKAIAESRKATEKIQSLELKYLGSLVAAKEYVADIDRLSIRLTDACDEKCSAEAIILEIQSRLVDTESQLCTANQNIASSKDFIRLANKKCSENDLLLKLSQEENAKLSTEVQNLNQLEKHHSEKIEMINQENMTQKLEHRRKMHESESNNVFLRQKLTNHLSDTSNRIWTLSILIHQLESDKDALFAEISKMENIHALDVTKITELSKRLDDYEENAANNLTATALERDDALERERSALERLATNEAKLSELLAALSNLKGELDVTVSDRDSAQRETQSTADKLQESYKEIKEMKLKMGLYSTEASQIRTDFEHVKSERDAAMSAVKQLEEKVEFSDIEFEELKKKHDALNQKVISLVEECDSYRNLVSASEKLALEILKQLPCTSDVPSERDSSQNESLKSYSTFPVLLASLQDLLSRLDYYFSIDVRYKEESCKLRSCQNELNDLKLIHAEAASALKLLQENVNDELQIEKANFVSDLDQLRFEVEFLRNSISSMEEEKMQLQANLQAAETENHELKLLLVNSNIIVKEAKDREREIALLLEEKDHNLGLAHSKMLELETMIRNLNEESQFARNFSVTNEQFDATIKEKIKLEQLLKEEKENRIRSEAELKLRMSQEQRSLILDAEQEMLRLREELDLKKSDLKRAESEAYASRESRDEYEDQFKQTLNRCIQLESQIAAIENENARLRRASTRQETEKENELIHVKDCLNQAKLEQQKFQVLIKNLENKTFILRNEKEMISKELEAAKNRLSNFSNNEIQEKNKQLLLEVDRLRGELNSIQCASKENIIPSTKLNQLEVDNERLRHKLKSYVERCEKLESSKLTKDKLEAIKKLMADKTTLEQDLKVAKEDIDRLKKNSSDRISFAEDDEITKLRFDNLALENQIRKFAVQCQHLEDEKAKIFEALRSSKLDKIDYDIEKGIVILCDKLASLEKECELLSNLKEKSLSTQLEFEVIQKQNDTYQNKLFELQKRIDQSDIKDSQQSKLIKSLEKSVEKLREEVEEAQRKATLVANEKRSQLKYLEQENLQLMIDLKTARKQIYGLKSDLALAQNTISVQKHNIESTNRSATKQHTTPSQKENVNNFDNTNENKISSNNMNLPKPMPSGSKTRDNQIASRLRDTFAASDENTQECKQS